MKLTIIFESKEITVEVPKEVYETPRGINITDGHLNVYYISDELYHFGKLYPILSPFYCGDFEKLTNKDFVGFKK